MPSDAVLIELVRDASVLLGGVSATMGVAWISSRGPKRILDKVAEVKVQTDGAASELKAELKALSDQVAKLTIERARQEGFDAGQEDRQP